MSHSRQLRRSRGARALLREHLDRLGEPLALGHLVPGVGDLQHHRACQEHKASDRGTGYDEASNGGLHILTC